MCPHITGVTKSRYKPRCYDFELENNGELTRTIEYIVIISQFVWEITIIIKRGKKKKTKIRARFKYFKMIYIYIIITVK